MPQERREWVARAIPAAAALPAEAACGKSWLIFFVSLSIRRAKKKIHPN